MFPVDIDQLKSWIGRTERADDIVTRIPVKALSATLDRDDPEPDDGAILPPLWHWLFFLPIVRQSGIGADGHPERGGFLPPVPLPRRMWAGSRFHFDAPLRVGERIRRVSTIADVTMKEGRTGPLIFVLTRHEITGESGGALTEEHDIVYRGAATPDEPVPPAQMAPASAGWRRDIQPNDVLLFRYSALTFNGHRIHYDRRYATEVEGYPGLIVHGPLIATLLTDLIRRNCDAPLKSFSFRAIKPVFDTAPFAVCGAPGEDDKIDLWAMDCDGALCMRAQATTG